MFQQETGRQGDAGISGATVVSIVTLLVEVVVVCKYSQSLVAQ